MIAPAAAALAAVLAGIGAAQKARQPPPADEPAPVAALLSEAEVRERVEAYLGAIDTPIRAADWRALGPGAVAVLRERAAARDELPSRRARAVDGLAAVGGRGAEKAVLELARTAGHPFVVRSAALRGAGRLLPTEKLLPALRPVLEGPGQARVRAVAAEVLAHHAGKEACPSVRAQVTREREEHRAQFHRAVTICEK
jgi:HEAT repeat protein